MRVPLFRWQHRLHWWTGADDDFLGILLTVLLLGATAFIVGSEFGLIRRAATGSRRWPSRASTARSR